MHDRAMEHGDFQNIVNAFTQGLRELPTDYAARVKNFLAEYLGSLEHPVPFGGRTRDFGGMFRVRKAAPISLRNWEVACLKNCSRGQ